VASAVTATNLQGGQSGYIPIQGANGQTGFIATGTVGYVLQMQSGNTATWVSTSSLTSGALFNTATLVALAVTATFAQSFNTSTLVASAVTATNSTNLQGGTAGYIPIQGANGQTGFIATGTVGYYLQMAAGNTATWSAAVGFNTATLVASALFATTASFATTATFAQSFNTATLVGSAVTATNIAGGLAGYIAIQGANGQTAFIATGTVGYVLQMQLGNTATWVSTSSLVSGASFTGGTVPNSVNITNNTQATSTTTGSLVVVGGVGIGGSLFVGGISTFTNTTTSISTNTGAVQVRGGVGVGDSVYVGNRVGFVNTSNVSVVYQFYNAATNSLDTVFG
jgi:hypothetical protein